MRMPIPPVLTTSGERVDDLQTSLRRAVAELERTSDERRAHAAWVRERWRGRRHADFEAALDELEARCRRLLADLRVASVRTASQLDGRR